MDTIKTKGKFRAALIEAVKSGNSSALNELFIFDADFKVTDDEGNTLPMIAIVSGHENLLPTLYIYKANFKAANRKGETAMSLAIKYKSKARSSLIIYGAE